MTWGGGGGGGGLIQALHHKCFCGDYLSVITFLQILQKIYRALLLSTTQCSYDLIMHVSKKYPPTRFFSELHVQPFKKECPTDLFGCTHGEPLKLFYELPPHHANLHLQGTSKKYPVSNLLKRPLLSCPSMASLSLASWIGSSSSSSSSSSTKIFFSSLAGADCIWTWKGQINQSQTLLHSCMD